MSRWVDGCYIQAEIWQAIIYELLPQLWLGGLPAACSLMAPVSRAGARAREKVQGQI